MIMMDLFSHLIRRVAAYGNYRMKMCWPEFGYPSSSFENFPNDSSRMGRARVVASQTVIIGAIMLEIDGF